MFKKGKSGNPNGRPKRPEIEILRNALESARKKYGKHLIEFAVEQAYENIDVLRVILNKILPEKLDIESRQRVINVIRKLSDEQLKQS